MKTMLKEDAGLPRRLLYTLAVISGVSVANLYYNQPLLDMIRQDLGISTLAANRCRSAPESGIETISILACGWVPNPSPGATVSSFSTRSAPKWIRFGS